MAKRGRYLIAPHLPLREFGGAKRAAAALSIVMALLSPATALHAAKFDAGEYQALVEHAAVNQVAPTLVNLAIDVPLRASDTARGTVRARLLAMEDAVLRDLGADALASTTWRNGLGQLGVFVSAQGLHRLAGNPQVRSFGWDNTRHLRSVVDLGDRELRGLEATINRQGYVDIEIVQNLDHLEFELLPTGGAIMRPNALQRAEIAAKRLPFLKTFSAAAVLNIQRAMEMATDPLHQAPQLSLRVTKEGLYQLLEHRDVRWLGDAVPSLVEAPRLFPDVLTSAREQGFADVTIELRRFKGYSPFKGAMSEKAWNNQQVGVRRAFAEILGSVDPQAALSARYYESFASASLRLPVAAIERIYSSPDSRIGGVRLNKAFAVSQLAESTAQINMPPYWNAGFRADGQTIAILDTGVEKVHQFLQTSAGQPKVVAEGCFGTNSATHKSLCGPQANSAGDHVGPGAGAPCSRTDFEGCYHGTHVAGIAAGRGVPASPSANINGVANGAQIISVQVFSKRIGSSPARSDQPVRVHDEDVGAALSLLSQTGLSEMTVNMSFGSQEANVQDCSYDDPLWKNTTKLIQDSIAALVSMRVPVVAATANESYQNGIATPACVPKVIKVASVNDDPAGVTVSSFSNVAPASKFSSPIFLAPGSSILSSIPATYGELGGTSMAAPHVAGLYAVVKAAVPGVSVADVSAYLQAQGVAVTIPAWTGQPSYVLKRVRLP